MSGIARLYTQPEAAEMCAMQPQCETDARIIAGLHCAIPWGQMPDLRCAVCNQPTGGHVTYVAVLLPIDPEMGLGVSGGVCGSCGGLPRIQLEAWMTREAILWFVPIEGHA